MNLLHSPFTKDEMLYKITTAGITAIHTSHFRSRYNNLSKFDINAVGAISSRMRIINNTNNKRKKTTQKSSLFITKETTIQEVQPIIKPIKKKSSLHSKRSTIRRRIEAMILSQKINPKMYFVTITFPEKTTDVTCYKLLNTWLTTIRQHYSNFNYLWVAERQQNTTLHFHLLTTNFVTIKKWNLYMRNSIINMIKKKEIDWSYDSANKYNGIDLAKDRKNRKVTNFAKESSSRSLRSYITKYITKNETTTTRGTWNCSSHYSNLITEIRCTKRELTFFIKGVLLDRTKSFFNEHYTFIPWQNKPPKKVLDHLSNCNSFLQELLKNQAIKN